MEENTENFILLDNILDAIATPVIQITKDKNIQLINAAALELLRLSREQAIGKKCSDLFNTNDCESGQCATLRSMKENRKIVSETVAHIRGRDIPIKYYASPLYDKSGEIIGAVEYILDLTDQKAAINDILELTNSAVRGDLKKRVNATKYQGDFKMIIEGINKTLDSIIIPINEAIRVSLEYSHSNFTVRFDPSLSLFGDWINFKDALNKIGIEVSDTISQVNNSLQDINLNAEKASSSIREVAKGAQQIALNANDVSVNSIKGEDGINQILKAMDDLNITVAEVSKRAEEVSISAQQADEHAKTGVNLAKKSESTMEEIKRSSSGVEEIVREIHQQMNEIGKIVRLISDIASQTNLLALNAAIEAARAGEAGRGFAVVAAEVKSLAQDSRISAENISDMITSLQEKANKANEAMNQASKIVETGSEVLSDTLVAFDEIAKLIEGITHTATNVASSSEEQAASVEEVTASIGEVSKLIQNTTKDAGDAVSVTKETSESIIHIGEMMTDVANVVNIMAEKMIQFKV